MPRFVAFLRAINIGNGRTVKMDSLRRPFETLGFSEVATFMASGNVVFKAEARNTKTLERKIERNLQEALGYEVVAFIRTDKELSKIANYKPFHQAKLVDAAELNIIFLVDALDKKTKQKVMALETDTDTFHVHGREIYWLRHKKQGTSTYATVPLDKALDEPFTIRSAKTVKRLTMRFSSTKPE